MTEVLWESGQSFKSDLLLRVARGIGVMFLGVLFFSLDAFEIFTPPNTVSAQLLSGGLLVLGFLMILPSIRQWYATSYRITADGVIETYSFVRRSEKQVKFDQVTNISESQGVLDRYFGCGTISIQTAGMGVGLPEIMFKHINDYETASKLIQERI